MALALLGVAFAAGTFGFFNKMAINRGYTSKKYLFSIYIGIGLLSPVLFLFFPYQIDWGIYAALTMLGAAIAITIKVLFTSKVLEKVTPLEASAFATLAIVVTFVLDIIFGVTAFNLFAMLALIIVLIGCLIVSKGGKRIAKVKWFVLFLIIGQLGQGYMSYFATTYFMSTATFLFYVFAGSAIAIIPFHKRFGKIEFKNILFGTAVQAIGLFGAVLEVILAKESATYFMLRIPAIMVMTMVLTYVIRKDIGEKPDKTQMLGAVVVFVGLLGYTLTQI